jgi:serine/threonine protein kinase
MSESAAAPSLPGQSIAGRYWLEAQLGVDRFGVSYRAKHAESQRPVALKLLRSSTLERAESLLRGTFERGQPIARSAFERDLSAIIALEHPNIAALLDHGQVDGQLYIVSEWLEGETLAARLRRGPLSAAEALAIIRQLLAALSAAHAMRLIHGDLAPDKIFLQRRQHGPERVKLLDLGLASLHRPEAVPAAEGGERLTTYLAPEQRGGASADARSDVYAVGKILATMLARPSASGMSAAIPGDGNARVADDSSARIADNGGDLRADDSSARITDTGSKPRASDAPTDDSRSARSRAGQSAAGPKTGGDAVARRRRDSGSQPRQSSGTPTAPLARAGQDADTTGLREVIRRATSAEPTARFADAAHMLCELIDELARESAGNADSAPAIAASRAPSTPPSAPFLQPMAAGSGRPARSGARVGGSSAPLPIPLPATPTPRGRAFLVVESLLAVSLLIAGAGSVMRMLAARNERAQANHSAAKAVTVPGDPKQETKINPVLAAPAPNRPSATDATGRPAPPPSAAKGASATVLGPADRNSDLDKTQADTARHVGASVSDTASATTAAPAGAKPSATAAASSADPTALPTLPAAATTPPSAAATTPPSAATNAPAVSGAKTPPSASSAESMPHAAATTIPITATPTGMSGAASANASKGADAQPTLSTRIKAGSRDPWQDPVPPQLNGLLAQAASGGEGSDWTVRHLQEFNQSHPDDPRGHLLLGRFYLNRMWRSDALAQFAIALQRDSSLRGTPELLPLLVDIVAQGRATVPAQALIEKYWGRDALPEVDSALGRVTNPDAARRINDLSARLYGNTKDH